MTGSSRDGLPGADAMAEARGRLRLLRRLLAEGERAATSDFMELDAPRLRAEIADVERTIHALEAAARPPGPMAVLRPRGDAASPIEQARRELARLLDARGEAEGRVEDYHRAVRTAVSVLERSNVEPERDRLRQALDRLHDLDQQIDRVGAQLRRLEWEAKP